MRCWAGIDPGANGGIAVATDTGEYIAWRMPGRDDEIASLIRTIAGEYAPELWAIENVHAMPGNGVVSTFKFGRAFGFLLGVIHAFELPFILVSPQRWQSGLGIRSHGDKRVTKAAALELKPDGRVTHATSEALLIAEYAKRTAENGNDKERC
jgi:Holliday junction resolvasome RuvABC endonuclease subunit